MAIIMAVALFASAMAPGGVGSVMGSPDTVPGLSPLSLYAQYDNGTLLDEGVLIYYTVAELKQLCVQAVAGGRIFDADARAQVQAQLPFSPPVSQQFMDKYEDGTTWYLVDIVKTLYPDDGIAPDEPSLAYLVTNRGISALQFIFITKNGEQFSVHIDTHASNADVRAELTEYAEATPLPTVPSPTPAPPPSPQPQPDPDLDPVPDPDPPPQLSTDPDGDDMGGLDATEPGATDLGATDMDIGDPDTTRDAGGVAETETDTNMDAEADELGTPFFSPLATGGILDPGGDPLIDPDDEPYLVSPSDPTVKGAEFLVDAEVTVADLIIVDQDDDGSMWGLGFIDDDHYNQQSPGDTWDGENFLFQGQVWTYKVVEPVNPGSPDGLFKITLYAWAKPYRVPVYQTDPITGAYVLNSDNERIIIGYKDVLLDGGTDLVISDFIWQFEGDDLVDYYLCDPSGFPLPGTLQSDGAYDYTGLTIGDLSAIAPHNVGLSGFAWDPVQEKLVWTISGDDPELTTEANGSMKLTYYVQLIDKDELVEGIYYTGMGEAHFTPEKENGYYYSRSSNFTPAYTIEYYNNNSSNDTGKGRIRALELTDPVRGITIRTPNNISFDFHDYVPGSDPWPPAPFDAFLDGWPVSMLGYLSISSSTGNATVNGVAVNFQAWTVAKSSNQKNLLIAVQNPANLNEWFYYEIENDPNRPNSAPIVVRSASVTDDYRPKLELGYWDHHDCGCEDPNHVHHGPNCALAPHPRTEPLGVNGWTKLVHPITLYKYDATPDNERWLDGAEFKLYRIEQDGNGQTVETQVNLPVNTTADGKIVFPFLAPGDYKLVETQAPENYYPLDEPIYFTVGDFDSGNGPYPFSPQINGISGGDGLVSYDTTSGLFLFVGNDANNGLMLTVKKDKLTEDIFGAAHGAPRFLFEIKKYGPGPDPDDVLLGAELLDTWVGIVDVSKDPLYTDNKYWVVFQRDGGGSPAFALEYGYIYIVTELGNMRYGSYAVELDISLDDFAYSEQGEDPYRSIVLDLSVFGELNEAKLPLPDVDDTIPITVTFSNEKVSDDYLSNSSEVKVNQFTYVGGGNGSGNGNGNGDGGGEGEGGGGQ